MQSFAIHHRLSGFYFFYYAIVGTFMPFWSLYLEDQGFAFNEIGLLSSIAIITRFSWRVLVSLCVVLTAFRWCLVGIFPTAFLVQFFAQSLHAFSFGLFHLIAMRVIFQNFTFGQQGRGQALYSTMWGLGVASGSLLAGHYWEQIGGSTIFIVAGLSALFALLFVRALPKSVNA